MHSSWYGFYKFVQNLLAHVVPALFDSVPHTLELCKDFLKTKEDQGYWLSWTLLHSHLTSTPFNIYGRLV